MDGLDLDLDKDIAIDVTDLQSEWVRLPALAYRYSKLAAEAEATHSLEKAILDELKAAKYIKLKNDFPKLTENGVEAHTDTDSEIKEQLRKVLLVKRDCDTLKGFLKGILTKESMLIQLGASSRAQ